MALGPLLRKELLWVRHNAAAILVVLLLLPAAFGLATAAFHQVIPEDVPVAVVPANERVTSDEMATMEAVTAFFAAPRDYRSEAAARRALDREEVYGIVVVPHGLYDDGHQVTVQFIVEGEIVPYEQPSIAVASVLRSRLDSQLPADVALNREVTGRDATLSEYLLTVGAVLLLAVYAFTYVPYNVAGERRVFRRLRVESSLRSVVVSKFLVFGALMLVPLGAIQAAAIGLGYDVTVFSLPALAVLLVTFWTLTAVSLGIMFLTNFRSEGRFLNVGVLFGLLLFANLLYPAGYFSPIRRTIARLVPLHYAMLVVRGLALKGQSIGLYTDYLAVLAGTAVLAVAWLALSMHVYRRRA